MHLYSPNQHVSYTWQFLPFLILNPVLLPRAAKGLLSPRAAFAHSYRFQHPFPATRNNKKKSIQPELEEKYAGSSRHSYIHAYFQMAQLKCIKWNLKYSQLFLWRCDNICCFKTWVQLFSAVVFLIRHQIFNRSVYAKTLQPNPQKIST